MSLCIKEPNELEEALKIAVKSRIPVKDILDEHANILAEALMLCERNTYSKINIKRITRSIMEVLAFFNITYSDLMFSASNSDPEKCRRTLKLLAEVLVESNELAKYMRACKAEELEKARRSLKTFLNKAEKLLENE